MTCNCCEATGSGRLLGWTLRFKNDQILWRSPRWDRWSPHDPDIFWRTCMTTLLQQRIKNRSSRKYYNRSGGSTCLPTELHNPLYILINWAVFQQRSGLQCSHDWNANNKIGIKNLEAYGDSKLIVNQVHWEYKVIHGDLVPYHNATIYMAEKFKNFYIDHVSH